MDGAIEGTEEGDRLVRELSASPHLRRTGPRFRRPSRTCPAAGRENPDDSSLIHYRLSPLKPAIPNGSSLQPEQYIGSLACDARVPFALTSISAESDRGSLKHMPGLFRLGDSSGNDTHGSVIRWQNVACHPPAF